MRRFNLQLFSNVQDGYVDRRAETQRHLDSRNNLKDYAKSMGLDTSWKGLQNIASQYGMNGYEGTTQQNIDLLAKLKAGQAQKKQSAPAPAPKPVATPAPAPTPAPTVQTPKKDASPISGVDKAVYDKMNSTFQASDAYLQAMEYTNGLLQQLSSGRTSYTDQIKDLMGQIQDRDPFSYDADTDVLFQQALSSAMRSGKTAMQDTMGQAAALTGGYGSSYATTAGAQAYNAFIQDAYDNLPEYYQMALETYQMEGDEMYKQLSMLGEADAQEYQRNFNAWEANYNSAQQMYQNEYTAWQDDVNNAFNLAGMENADFWNTANFNEGVRQWEAEYAQAQAQFNQEMAYKNASLAQAQSQWEAEMAQNQKQWEASYNWEKQQSANERNTSDAGALKTPSESQMKRALDAYNENGEDGLAQYIDSLIGVDEDAIIDYVYQYGQKQEKKWFEFWK